MCVRIPDEVMFSVQFRDLSTGSITYTATVREILTVHSNALYYFQRLKKCKIANMSRESWKSIAVSPVPHLAIFHLLG